MTEATHRKLDLAIELLNEAIRQFLDGKSFVCALSLAGAAEEILGKTVGTWNTALGPNDPVQRKH